MDALEDGTAEAAREPADRLYAADLTGGREACPAIILFRKSPSAPQTTAGRPQTTSAQAFFLAAPVLGVPTTQFPSIADSVLHWLQPRLDAIK